MKFNKKRNFLFTSLIRISFILLFISLLWTSSFSQRSDILQNIRFGFGGGINLTNVHSTGNSQLYEDLSGNVSINEYSSLFKNFGNQYFFIAEYYKDNYSISLRPGTYTFNFSIENILFFDDAEVSQTNSFTLRYFSLPVEFKYIVDSRNIRPFAGGLFSYSTLLGGGKSENTGFISTRLALGILGGAYYDAGFSTLGLTIGYDYGLNITTRKDNRYNTAVSTSYSQDDIILNNLYLNISMLFSLEKKRSYSNTKCRY